MIRLLSSQQSAPLFASGSGRRDLAQAIANPGNPLTARVLVNRVWQWHFGRGLVATPSDFGTRGAAPSHPHLLNYLAARFMAEGWSIKKLHRWIMTSATYMQASRGGADAVQLAKRDPDNRLLARHARRRLEFEALRDSILAVAGDLDTRLDGPAEQDFLSRRRSLYLRVDRQDLPNAFTSFDFPSADISIARRAETTVPHQALFLMNHPFMLRAAKRLVLRLNTAVAKQADDPTRISWIYERLFARTPTAEELKFAREFLHDFDQEKAWPHYAQALLLSNEFTFID